jgi:hypothetical protein
MNKITPFIFFLLIGISLSILFSSGQIENPDTHLRLTEARLITENHSLELPADVGEDLHGNIAVNSNGKRFMVYNPGQTILFVPIYYLVEFLTGSDYNCYYNTAFIVSFINLIVHSFCSYLLFLIALSISASKKKAYLTAFVFCFTSYSFSFAQSTFEHHFEMLFILLGYYFILSNNFKNNGLLSGLAIALGLIFRSTTILALPGLLFLANKKQKLFIIIGSIPGLLIILFYNYYRFSNPLESGYNLAWYLAHGQSIVFWDIARLPFSLFGFIFSPAKGLLIFSPTLIIGFFGFRKFWRNHSKLTLSILILCSFYLILFSMNFAWHGSIWSFGPRYILPILPFLYLPIIELKLKRFIYPILFLAFLSQILLMSVNYKRELLEQHIQFNGIDENQYIYSFGNIPYLVQAKQLIKIIPKNLNQNLVNDFPNTPWKKETRIASSKHVLNYSIEKNSINFWWVRIFHWKIGFIKIIISILLLMSASLGCLLIFRYAKKIF